MSAEQEHIAGTPLTRATFDLKTFFSLLGIVVAGVATTVASLYSVQLNMRSELVDMDRRWIERTAQVEERVRVEIKALREDLTTPEVREKLIDLSARIDRLENLEFGRRNTQSNPQNKIAR